MTGPAAGAMNTADVAGLARSELTAAGIRIRGHAERAVLSMLTEHPSPALGAAVGAGR